MDKNRMHNFLSIQAGNVTLEMKHVNQIWNQVVIPEQNLY